MLVVNFTLKFSQTLLKRPSCLLSLSSIEDRESQTEDRTHGICVVPQFTLGQTYLEISSSLGSVFKNVFIDFEAGLKVSH